ncbi:MAG: VOC family protein [Chloroflexota bacterium]|nr:VOC family protein [Chloroflexota bacterium]
MADTEMWDAPDIVPSITYRDLPRALEWLERVFGFRERVDARLTWPGGAMAWMEVGNGLFSISTPDETWQRGPGRAASGFVMKVYVEDVDRHFARARAEGAEIISEPQDGFWGGRIYRALDHEGHQWEISQRGRDLAAERWQLPPGVTRGVSK